MRYKCNVCKEEFLSDEVIGVDINDNVVSLDEYDLELNSQNPDYLHKIYCEDCYDKRNRRYILVMPRQCGLKQLCEKLLIGTKVIIEEPLDIEITDEIDIIRNTKKNKKGKTVKNWQKSKFWE